MPNGYYGYGYGGYPYDIGSYWLEQLGKAPHLGHVNHLCDIVEKGTDVETIKNLVKDAKFMCKTCGRVAAKQKNLCDPIPI